MLTISDPSERSNWEQFSNHYCRERPEELDQAILKMARDGVSPKRIKQMVCVKSGYVDVVLWRARRRNLL